MALNDWKSKSNLIGRLSLMIKNENIPHAYIVEGDNNIDKFLFAKDFLKAIVCENVRGIGCDDCINCRKIDSSNYEDLYIVGSESESVRDQDILDLQLFLKNKPSMGRNFAIIKNAQMITERAQNRLLKTLEEPAGGTVIILLVENSDKLLQTVRSRCALIKLTDSQVERNEEHYTIAQTLATQLMERDYFHRVLRTVEFIKTKEELMQLLDALEFFYRNCLLGTEKNIYYNRNDLIGFVHTIEETKYRVQYNMNIKYALKCMLLKIGG